MTGFEVSFQGKTIYASIDKGRLHIDISYFKETYLDIAGFNETEHITWYSDNIDDVDNIIVKAVEVKQISEIKKSFSKETIDLLVEYAKLKQELKKEGLI
jgi:hypothetical protein